MPLLKMSALGKVSNDPMDILTTNGSGDPKEWEYVNRPEGLRYVSMSADGKTILNSIWADWPLGRVSGV